MSRHQRMANYLKELKEYRERYQKSHGHLILKEIDKEIIRVQDWLVNPKEVPPHTYHGLHVNAHTDRNIKRSFNRVITNRYINN